jgi:leucyl-tRNA synthetase
MPQWAGSSWYWLRYADPLNKKSFADKSKQKYWTPVDVYFGGMEHTTLHLLYSRFWNLFLYDQKLVTSREPYVQRKPHGIILGSDGEKMSKSRGNVVNPDVIVKSHGADTLRMYELFLGPHEATVSWNEHGHVGVKRFLDRVWEWVDKVESKKLKVESDSERAKRALHKLIKKVTEDIENFRFNTSISAFMEFYNEVKEENISTASIKTFLTLLYPFAPHISEELTSIIAPQLRSGSSSKKKSLQLETWPKYDQALVVDQTVEIIVQINGKVKGRLSVARDSNQTTVEGQAGELETIKQALMNQSVKRVVFVPNRLINFVV